MAEQRAEKQAEMAKTVKLALKDVVSVISRYVVRESIVEALSLQIA